ncbi:TVB5 protein, partial [Amia calva]|nr:TVB5 protein [Amia calva]
WLFSYILVCVTGFSDTVTVTQKPPILFKSPGINSDTLHCEHDDNTHFNIFWYRQDKKGGFPLIGYSTGKDNVNLEQEFKDSKFKMTRPETRKSTLQILNLVYGDTAVYFCASSVSQ